jgi:hypothetical protein
MIVEFLTIHLEQLCNYEAKNASSLARSSPVQQTYNVCLSFLRTLLKGRLRAAREVFGLVYAGKHCVEALYLLVDLICLQGSSSSGFIRLLSEDDYHEWRL